MFNTLQKISLCLLLASLSCMIPVSAASENQIQAFEVVGDGAKAVENNKRVIKYYFMLDCPYCMSIEEYVQNWELSLPEEYSLQYVPVVNEDRHQYMALFLEGFRRIKPKKSNQFIQRLMYQIQVKGVNPSTISLYFNTAEKMGVPRDDYVASIRKKETLKRVKAILKEQEEYNIVGTPMFVVSDRFKTSLGHVQGNANILFQVLNGLVSEDLRTKGFTF